MPIYKTLEKSWILNILRKESIFLYSKRKIFFRRIGVFTSLGVAIFRVTLRDRAQIFLKKITQMMTQFVFISSTWIKCEEWKECGMKNISYSVWRLLQCKLNKKNYLEENLLTSNFHFTFINDYQVRFPAKIYLFQVNNRDARKTCEKCLKSTIKTPEQS